MPRPPAPLSVVMLCITGGVMGLWLLYGLAEVVSGHPPAVVSFRAFGLVSPLVGLLCLGFSLAVFADSRRRGARPWRAIAAITLSVLIGAVPFASLPYDPS